MNHKGLILFIFSLMFLVGCSQIPLLPEKDKVTKIENVKVEYILPKSVIQDQSSFNGIKLRRYTTGTQSKMESIFLRYLENGMIVEKKLHNQMAGSGTVYNVETKVKENKDNIRVTFTPTKKETYQQGLVLPYPIPEFDIQEYLTTASIQNRFEVNSEYPVSSIKANFSRSLGHDPVKGSYITSEEGHQVVLKVDVQPYRTGSKVLILAYLNTNGNREEQIDTTKIFKNIKKRVSDIVTL